ncbi:hypothetical protein [Caballeronia humi]|uniref:Phospholipid:lipid A palmitoyltransferase n=1 Tax=Caballeronia humi TaxID=326474 RepID=A0A158JEK0_9BURK|nr:hypothetical protein [Caballeronia humi]SAL67308.1 phospholipid:lipid A palmitoyltransferase [Caballeronia humi]
MVHQCATGGSSLEGGFFAGITARQNIAHYLPVPLPLPIGSMRYRQTSILATFIPRLPGANKGVVAFFFGAYAFQYRQVVFSQPAFAESRTMSVGASRLPA